MHFEFEDGESSGFVVKMEARDPASFECVTGFRKLCR